MTKKLIAGLVALLAYGSLGASVWGEPLRASESVGVEAPARAEDEELATSDSTAGTPMGKMSDEEAERRREVCVKQNKNCFNKCQRYFKPGEKRNSCYGDCQDDLADCMKEIP